MVLYDRYHLHIDNDRYEESEYPFFSSDIDCRHAVPLFANL